MTSGNTSDEPIAYEDGDAIDAPPGIADRVLGSRPPDSSAMRRFGDADRRRHGVAAAPLAGPCTGPLDLPIACPVATLALGGQLKATFALGRDGMRSSAIILATWTTTKPIRA